MDKHVFIIFVQGGGAEVKVRKVCDSFGANLYPCPNDPRERQAMLDQIESRLDDLDVVLEKSIGRRKTVLLGVVAYIKDWNAQIVKEKAIYHIMNLFNYDAGRQCLIAEGWCPLNDIEKVQDALKRANERSGAVAPSIITVVPSTEQVIPSLSLALSYCIWLASGLTNKLVMSAAHPLPGEQVYELVSGHRGLLWHRTLQGSQPRRVHHRHLPLPVRDDVRRPGARRHAFHLRRVPVRQGGGSLQDEAQ